MKKDEPKTMPPAANFFGCAGFLILIAILLLMPIITNKTGGMQFQSTGNFMIIIAVSCLFLAVYFIIRGKKSQKEIGVFKTSNEAIEELKKWKEKLDLQLISQEDYEKKKTELSKFI